MKRISLLTTLILLLLTVVQAQLPPQAINYSAVARNALGEPITMATIGIQISILKTSTVGQVIYSENHSVNTDAFGLLNLIIGTGSVQQGSMSDISWETDNYYLKVGMDITGGHNFKTMGVTQFLSVPYALHAKSAKILTGQSVVLQAGLNVTVTGKGTTADPYIVSAIEKDNIKSPTVKTEPASNVQAFSATISGTTNANRFLSNVSFEYGLTANYGKEVKPLPSIATGDSTISFSANLSGLLSRTTYHYRIKAENAIDFSNGDDMTFTTDAAPPTIIAYSAGDSLHSNNVKILTLSASVNANGIPTSVTFEYGTTMSLGSSAIANPPSISSINPTAVQADVVITTPRNTLYYYRVKAVSSEGTVYSPIDTFVSWR